MKDPTKLKPKPATHISGSVSDQLVRLWISYRYTIQIHDSGLNELYKLHVA